MLVQDLQQFKKLLFEKQKWKCTTQVTSKPKNSTKEKK
jgi:hypothetical protein